MIGWLFRRAHHKRMKRLLAFVEIARTVAFAALAERYRAAGEPVEQRLTAKAAAATNFLFGVAQEPGFAEMFDLPALQRDVLEWLGTQPALCELVVQSLRVNNFATRELGVLTSVVGEPALRAYGKRFGGPPDPREFEALVDGSLGLLPHAARQQVRELRARLVR